MKKDIFYDYEKHIFCSALCAEKKIMFLLQIKTIARSHDLFSSNRNSVQIASQLASDVGSYSRIWTQKMEALLL